MYTEVMTYPLLSSIRAPYHKCQCNQIKLKEIIVNLYIIV